MVSNSFVVVWRHFRVRSLMLGLFMLVGPILARGAVPYLVLDINPGTSSSNPRQFSATDGILYFSANDGFHGEKLWQSDGTAGNTIMSADSHPGLSRSPHPSSGSFDNLLGTIVANADGHPGRSDSSSSGSLVEFIDALFFSAGNGAKGRNGAGGNGGAGSFADVNGTLFFKGSDGTHGAELWKSDGTAAGTVMVKDINPGSGDSSPGDLVNVNGTLYFSADDGVHGRELWASDGTTSGTVMVADIAPGAAGSSPASLTVSGHTLFFSADDGVHGTEPWALSFMSTPAELSDFTVE
jgi:ELWxxDGT repeat protein